jgi:2-polyprenyl-3-methyl-5-hydroxy-6-metoxy-1,4-benzoquinol methylase
MGNNFIGRVFRKLITGPLKYGKQGDYNAKKYWHDRFLKYGDSIQGPGNEALSEAENIKMYNAAKDVFVSTCRKESISFETSRFCEIGLGNGFYTKILKDLGVQQYQGFDISDVIIPRMQERFSEFSFEQKDIGSDPITGSYDVVMLIDVIQHIVNKDKFKFALNNIKSSLADRAIFLMGPLEKKNSKVLYYVRNWTVEDVKGIFSEGEFTFSDPVNFRGADLYIIRKK